MLNHQILLATGERRFYFQLKSEEALEAINFLKTLNKNQLISGKMLKLTQQHVEISVQKNPIWFNTSFFKSLKFYFYIIRCVPVIAPPPLISVNAHTLSGRWYDAEFQRWFVPEYKCRGRRQKKLMEIALEATEFLVDLFATACSTVGETTKVPYWSRTGNLQVMTTATISFEKWLSHSYNVN